MPQLNSHTAQNKITDAAKNLTETGAKLESKVESQASDFAGQIKDKANSFMKDVGDSQFVSKITDRAGDVDQTVRSFVSEKPFVALAIAAGVGFVLAKAISVSTAPIKAAVKNTI